VQTPVAHEQDLHVGNALTHVAVGRWQQVVSRLPATTVRLREAGPLAHQPRAEKNLAFDPNPRQARLSEGRVSVAWRKFPSSHWKVDISLSKVSLPLRSWPLQDLWSLSACRSYQQ